MFTPMEERPVEIKVGEHYEGVFSGIFMGWFTSERGLWAVVEIDSGVEDVLPNKVRFTDRKASEVEWVEVEG